MSTRPIIKWFRQDLRIADNIALAKAVETEKPVICLFVLDDTVSDQWKHGGASRWWLHHSLEALADDIADTANRLILRRGPYRDVIVDLAREVDAEAVYWTRGYEPFITDLESGLKASLDDAGIEAKRFGGSLLFEPEEIKTGSGGPYRVYTPFMRALLAAGISTELAQTPKSIKQPVAYPDSEDLVDWSLLPTKPDWSAGLRETWTPGSAGAATRLDTFVSSGNVDEYDEQRNRPDLDTTSRLSPHLRFGEISPRQVWKRVSEHTRTFQGGQGNKGAETFLKEIGWREFSYHLLFHFPTLPEKPYNEKFAAFPWDTNERALTQWQSGKTGYPIVDAGMRQLYETGWMHNRVRMIVGSFLVKHLLIHWREGEDWFWDTLVDADMASNSASWQWVAGSGADAAPYFRIFNPMTQGEKFDPAGDYVRHWVPELKGLPKKHIHTPWEAPPQILAEAGVELGKTYPHPIVDHKSARQRALDGYEKVKQANG